jgi:ATP-dependent 26S proteasome regulatory subunit
MPGWEALGGLQAVVAQLKEMALLLLLYPDLFAHLGVTPPRQAF